jgi:ribosome maturation factor RimP
MMMKENNFSKFIGKRVFIVLKSGMIYNGVVKETSENFLFIKDKFDNPVVINLADISSLEEK